MDNVTREKLAGVKRLMEAAGSVGEAEAAAAAMQRLILRHNLTAEDLLGLGEQAKEGYEGLYFRVGPDHSQGLQWRLNLIYVLARYNFCVFIRYGHHGGHGIIVGQPSNQEAIVEMFHATVATIERLGESEYRALRSEPDTFRVAGSPGSVGWKNSFKLGFPAGLNQKMNLERMQEKKDDPKVGAMVLVKDADLEKAVEDVVGKTGTHQGSKPTNANGYRRGVEKGRAHEPQARLGGGLKELGG